MKRFFCLFLLAAFTGHTINAQQQPHAALRNKLQTLITSHSAVTGVSLLLIENRSMMTINNVYEYPMQSTFKFPLAMYVLDNVDKGKLQLDQKVHVTKADMHKNTWSPLAKKYPDGNVDIPLAELLRYTISESDNNACDILFKLVKGTKPVEQYIYSLGVKDISIKATEAQMATGWKVQYTNWVNPSAMTTLLEGVYKRKYLSDKSSALLIKLMTESSNSDTRIKGMLPKGAVVAHKTGTSDTNKEGLTAATNDIGIITLPNGKHLAIAVYVCDNKEPMQNGEKLIAEIARAAYDEYSK